MKGFIPKSYQDILLASVPYDAIKGGAQFEAGLAGTSHRFRTLGHDPIMGWIFGQVNILSDSLTTSDFTSYNVNNTIITGLVPTPQIFTRAYEQIKADKMTLPAAILRQAVHFGTDYFTKQGLPVPFISTIDNDLSKTLLTKFNVDMWSITRGAALAELINYIVALIHRLFYDPEKYSSPKVYEVKTRKIIR
ncbi:MAG: hypothetical protein IJT21_06175 [Synergistaceae bacterium]|nr:hypothetical protein [Synergistaceae bacterium]